MQYGMPMPPQNANCPGAWLAIPHAPARDAYEDTLLEGELGQPRHIAVPRHIRRNITMVHFPGGEFMVVSSLVRRPGGMP
ncbi:hypothetical protein NMY22_g17493 [Coprinellus aureogranulatus]|nr:hypothetical protein NMY22_g17493 [Coprinellus aureogranulatus]